MSEKGHVNIGMTRFRISAGDVTQILWKGHSAKYSTRLFRMSEGSHLLHLQRHCVLYSLLSSRGHVNLGIKVNGNDERPTQGSIRNHFLSTVVSDASSNDRGRPTCRSCISLIVLSEHVDLL